MKNYEKPVVLANDEIAEGVYAASGMTGETSGDCWTVEVTKDQSDAGGYCTFRVAARHSDSVTHISTKTVVTIVFNDTVTGAEFEGFEASVNGNTVTLTRESHANAYYSGDNFNTLLKIWSPSYKDIQRVSADISCTHAVNVQGGFD